MWKPGQVNDEGVAARADHVDGKGRSLGGIAHVPSVTAAGRTASDHYMLAFCGLSSPSPALG
jgi:hypothetical protein